MKLTNIYIYIDICLVLPGIPGINNLNLRVNLGTTGTRRRLVSIISNYDISRYIIKKRFKAD
jgi:hypothetical protein